MKLRELRRSLPSIIGCDITNNSMYVDESRQSDSAAVEG